MSEEFGSANKSAKGEGWPDHLERRRWPREPATQKEDRPEAPPALIPLGFSTLDLPLLEQFEAWRAHMAPLVEVHLPNGKSPDDGFLAEQIGWRLGDMLVVQQRTPEHSYIRDQAMLRSSPIDHWNLGLLRSGRAWTEVDRHVTETAPEEIFFRSLSYPYRGRITDSTAVLLFFSYESLANDASLLQAANNTILSGGLADLLVTYINEMEAKLSSLTAGEVPGVIRAVKDMVIACVTSSTKLDAKQMQTNMGMMERAHRYIHLNLHSGNLTPDTMCQALGISRTRLYQLFESSGGVLNYIRKLRLQQAYAELSDRTNHRPIAEIADAAGFDVAANFTRAFSHEFGVSPREIRRAMGTGHVASTAAFATRSHETTIGDWLALAG